MSTLPTILHKDSYKIRNWKEYSRSLCRRGRITLWLHDSVLDEWEQASQRGKRVDERTYCESIIQCCLLLKINYGLKLRQSTGFVESLFMLMDKSHLLAWDYTTLCRCQKSLPVDIGNRLARGENLSVGIDSTGLKVYGEGKWKVRKHSYSKRRTWQKLHLCMDLDTQEILWAELTGNDEDDASVGARMLKGKTTHIHRFIADGAYDKFGFREILGSDVLQIIPPLKNAVIQKGSKKKLLHDYLIQRNGVVEAINKHVSKHWKKESGYHRQSLNEVAMFRYKTIFGGELDARTLENQTTEVKLKCMVLNKFIGIGMPEAYKVS